MTRPQYAAELLQFDLEDKLVLEAACGSGVFSLAAAPLARRVCAVDLDSFRLEPEVLECESITFRQMDAAKTDFPDGTFDTAVVYNAAFHLEPVLPSLVRELFRVTRPGGAVIFLSSFSMDKPVIADELPPLLEGVKYTLTSAGPFLCLRARRPSGPR